MKPILYPEKTEESEIDNTKREKALEKEMDDFIKTFSFLLKDLDQRKEETPREKVRLNPNFKPIETLTKEFAFHQFVCLDLTILKMEKGHFYPSDWKDPNLVEKLEKKIKYFEARAENWNDWVMNKMIFNMHPETTGQYVEMMKQDDYVWQLLSRQLLIYKTFSAVIDDAVIEKEYPKFSEDKKDEENK